MKRRDRFDHLIIETTVFPILPSSDQTFFVDERPARMTPGLMR